MGDDLATEAPSAHDNLFSGSSRDRDPTARSAISAINAPDLPPRIDRASKPNGVTPPSTLLTTASARNSMGLSASNSNNGTYGRTAHERLFAGASSALSKSLVDSNPTYEDEYSTRINPTPEKRNGTNGSSLDRKQATPLIEKSSVSSYDSCNAAMQSLRLGPNAPDDLKSVPTVA